MRQLTTWTDYRRDRKRFWLTLLSIIPGVFAISVPLGLVFQASWPFPVVGFGWMAYIAVASYRLISFRCPGCHKHFFRTWWYSNSLARRCVHCELPKWSGETATDHELAA